MADYPEWVMVHKKKGTYINFQNGKYYLYAAHSERVPGTDKVRRVCDGYLGRITEAEGFIPARRKLSDSVRAYEYGLSDTALSLCGKIRSGLNREFRANGDYVFAGGILMFMHGGARQEFYEASWLSARMPGLDMREAPTGKQLVGMDRSRKMVEDTLKRHFGDDYADAVSLLPLVKAVRMGGEAVIAAIPEGVGVFIERHGLEFKEVRYG